MYISNNTIVTMFTMSFVYNGIYLLYFFVYRTPRKLLPLTPSPRNLPLTPSPRNLPLTPSPRNLPLTPNCGLFSIAAAYHAAVRSDIGSLTFNESRLRAHLIKCFEQKKLTRFPQSKKLSVTRPASQNLVIVVYCPCKKPDSFQNMIQCDQCGDWFHYTCAKVIKAPDDDWFCSNCK